MPETPNDIARHNTNEGGSESGVTAVTAPYVVSSIREKENVLATKIESFITDYLSITADAVTAITMWVFHTYALHLSDVTPYLHILAPERESGKSTLGQVIDALAARAETPGYMTGAALRRILDQDPPPTLILDELDPFFHKRQEDTSDLHQALNLGWQRGALATMSVRPPKGKGDDWMVKHFRVFGPKVLISIGELPDSIESRSIQIRLERKPKGEKKKKFRQRSGEAAAAPLRAMLSVINVPDELPEPEMPEELSGRQQDIWEPLVALADWLGGEWPEKVRAAAVSLHARHEDDSPGVALLRAIRDIFDTHPDSGGLYSHVIVDELLANEELPYTHSEGGRPLDASRLAAKLRPFLIRPLPMRLYDFGGAQQRGYWRVNFEDAWNRYL